MRILHLHERTELKGGAEIYIDQLHRLLPEYGHQSFWLGQDSMGKNPQNYLDEFIRINTIEIINIHNLYDLKLVKYCLDRLPVVKFSHSPVLVCPGGEKFWRYSQKPCEIKYGMHCFMHIYTEGCANRHPKRVLKAWNYVNFEAKVASKRYKKIVVMSDYIKNGLLECGIEKDKILCNPYFTDPLDYNALNPDSDSKRLLFIGRLASSKGPHLLIEVFNELQKTNENIFLDIVGDGIMASELKTLVAKLGIQKKVIFHGWLNHNDVNLKLKQCFLLAFPSVYPEAFGITGIEAMMHSKPVVGFDTGGVSTWLKNGETGYLVRRGDTKDLASKVQVLLDNPDVYTRMCRKANAYALENFSPDRHMKKLLETYTECLKRA